MFLKSVKSVRGLRGLIGHDMIGMMSNHKILFRVLLDFDDLDIFVLNDGCGCTMDLDCDNT